MQSRASKPVTWAKRSRKPAGIWKAGNEVTPPEVLQAIAATRPNKSENHLVFAPAASKAVSPRSPGQWKPTIPRVSCSAGWVTRGITCGTNKRASLFQLRLLGSRLPRFAAFVGRNMPQLILHDL